MYYKYAIQVAVILLLLPVSAPADEQVNKIVFPLKEVWRYRVPELEATSGQRAIYSTPAADGLRLYYASANGTCGALFKRSGEISWTFHFGEPFNKGLALFDDGPVVAATDFRLFALDRENGFVLWHRNIVSGLSIPISGSANSLLACDNDGGIFCIEPATGAIRWQFETTASVSAFPHIHQGRVFIGDREGNVYCLDESDGREIWKFAAGGGIRSGFAVREEWLFFGSDDNYLYSLDAGKGSLRWRTRTAGDVNGFPICSERTVFATPSDRTLRAYRCSNGHAREGSPLQLNASVVSPLLLDFGQVVIPRRNELVGVSGENLRETGKFTAPADITTGFFLDPESGILYFGCRSGEVMAIAPEAIAGAVVPLRDTAAADRGSITPTLELIPPESTPEEQPQVAQSPGEQAEAQPSPPEPELAEEETVQTTAPVAEDKPETQPEPGQDLELPTEVPVKVEQPEPEESALPTKPEEIPLSPGEALEKAREATASRQLELASKLWKTALIAEAEITYTVSIGLFCRRPAVLSLISSLAEHEVMVFDRQRDGQTCYFVCIGRFDSREEAEGFLENCDDEIKRQNPAAYRLDSFIP